MPVVDVESPILEPAQQGPALPPAPEPGQVVTVRGSTWAVTDVQEQEPHRRPSGDDRTGHTHVVRLQSLAEERLGQELTVVWELEVGHSLVPAQGLPEAIRTQGFDDPNTLAAIIDAVRWGAVTSADPEAYQAPFRSGANVEAYQLEPLRRALDASRANLLLADDVGLGKTIEAGLVVQELLLRHRARSVIIVCPPSLRIKWQDEMRDKFGLDFEIVDSELMAGVRRTHGLAANPFRLFPRTIVSMAWLSSIRAQRLLREVYGGEGEAARRYAFDVLVVDEAHHVAPASPTAVGGARGYAVDSKRTIAVRNLAEECEHRLFLSATPHNGYSESFTALMEMIDGRRFTRGARLDEHALREVAVRRLKTDLKDKNFKARELDTITFEPSSEEQEHFAKLESLLAESAKRSGKRGSADIVAMLLKKRFLSSPWSFALTMERYEESDAGRDLDIDDEQSYYAETLGSGQSDEEEGEADHPEFTALRRAKGGDPLSAASAAELSDLIEWGHGFESRPDSRLRALIEFLEAVCRPDGETWNRERVVVFTEYAATLGWIRRNLEQLGWGDHVAVIQGSTLPEEREEIRARFSADPGRHPVRILLATDSAGEGIDLQNHCHRLVNYDIPFNPSRIEQRIGRIDRYGQRETPEIFHFLPVSTSTTYAADIDFLRRVAEKIGNVELDLGSANQVVDADIQGHFTATGRKRPAGKKTIPEDGNAVIDRALASGTELDRHLTELQRRYARLKAEMHLTPGNARRVVDTALTLTGQPLLDPIEDEPLTGDLADSPVYRVPSEALSPAWQVTLKGLDTRLEPGVHRPITFDSDAANGRPDLIHVHLGHAIMRRATRILRSELFGGETDINRVTAVVIEDLPESCVAAVARLVLVGRGGVRLHEEVFLSGIRMNGRPLAEAKTEDALARALDAEDLVLVEQAVRSKLAERWNAEGSLLRTRLVNAMDKKAETRQARVADALRKREDADVERVREIFSAFRVNLRESLQQLEAALNPERPSLFDFDAKGKLVLNEDQERQLRQDIRAMEDRLDGLDAEERRELAAITERYTDVKPHVTGAAVVFALTPDDAERLRNQ